MIYSMQNRKMPSKRTVRLFIIATFALALLTGLMPNSFFFTMLAISFSSVALLSIPKITYPRILLILSGISVLSALVTYLLSRNIAGCIASVAFAPAAALLILTVRKRRSRSCGIVLAAIGMGAVYLACYLAAVYVSYHSISIALFKELLVSLEETMLASMKEYISSAIPTQTDLIDDQTLISVFRMVLALIPSIFVIMVECTVWMSTVLLRSIFRGYLYGADRFFGWKVTMNRTSAWIFCISTLLSILPYPEKFTWISFVFLNIMLALLPGFFCIGCSIWKTKLFTPQRRFSFLSVLLLVLASLFFSPIILIYLAALSGVMSLIAPKRQPQTPDQPT